MGQKEKTEESNRVIKVNDKCLGEERGYNGRDLGHHRKTKRANLLIIGTEEAQYYTKSTDNIFNKIIEEFFSPESREKDAQQGIRGYRIPN